MRVEVAVVHEWKTWLNDIADQTLPGGVSVAAVAAAMGAALAAKAIRVTLSRGELPPEERQQLEEAAGAVREARGKLLNLAAEDEAAYRRFLAAAKEPARAGESDERREAWLMVTGVPLQVAEACQNLLYRLTPLKKHCLPAVLVDLEIGMKLVLAGLDGGVRAGQANVKAWRTERMADPAPAEVARRLKELERKKA